MILLAAVLTGIGGLLLEMVLLRRHGLLLGNTAEASALVVSLFLLGLGIGGLAAGRIRGHPGRSAALLYAAVALTAPLMDFALRGAGAVSWWTGLLFAAAAPGALAVAMGAAFPLLFTLQPPGPWRAGLLVGANLLGSVVAAWWGGNFWIPDLGLTFTLWLGSGAYVLAAALLVLAPRAGALVPPARKLRFATGARLAFAAGALGIGHEVLLLRRLPFWLEGLQPTLAGVLAGCLVGFTLGSWSTGWVHRLWGRRAGHRVLALAAVVVCVAPHEIFGPALSRLVIGSPESWGPLRDGEVGLHLRILATALVSALPCFLVGAVVPLQLARLRHRASRPALAGRLFFWQGVGAVAGSLWIGKVAPAVAPASFFAWAPVSLAALCLALCWGGGWSARVGVAAVGAAALGAGGAGSVLDPRPPVQGSRFDRPGAYRYLAHGSDSGVTASVVFDRTRHSMLLFTDGFRAAETGPGTAYMKALGHLPMLLHPGVRRAAVIALGTGTTADALVAWPEPERIDVVEISPAVLSLVDRFAGDGPGNGGQGEPAFLADPRTRVRLADGRRYLARQPPGSLDLITIEPLLPYAPGTGPLYTAEFYGLASRALADGGLMVQWLPTHAMPREYFDTLLATFARSFVHTSVWLVDQSTIVVGSREPHVPERGALERRLAGLPPALGAALHESGLPRAVDVELALVGEDPLSVCVDAATLRDDRPVLERVGYWSGARKLGFYGENLSRLRELAAASGDASTGALREARLRGLAAMAAARLQPELAKLAVLDLASVRARVPDSVLVHREETLALRLLKELEVVARGGRDVRALAIRHLERDGRSALLQACAALPDRAGAVRSSPRARAAVETAMALDPLLWESGPGFLAALAPLVEAAAPVPLESIGRLPAGAELLAHAARDAALRAIFPVRVARAAIAELAQRPLDSSETAALRGCLDPLALELAADAVVHRRGDLGAEILPLWRSDLPMPPALQTLSTGSESDRLTLARGLTGHRGARARVALAGLLDDPRADIRREAGISLFETWGDAVPYDYGWDETRRRAAADRLRSLHNPSP